MMKHEKLRLLFLTAILIAGAIAPAGAANPPDAMTPAYAANPAYEAPGQDLLQRGTPRLDRSVPAVLDRLAPLAMLTAAAEAESGRIGELGRRNREGAEPFANGFLRSLTNAPAIRIDLPVLPAFGEEREFQGGILSRAGDRFIRWTGRIDIAAAWRVRIHLAGVQLPEGSRVEVSGTDGLVQGPVGPELITPDGELWLPGVSSSPVLFAVDLPLAALEAGEVASFRVDGVMETFSLDARGQPVVLDSSGISAGYAAPAFSITGESGLAPTIATCLLDISCATASPGIDAASKGVGRMEFVSGQNAFVCTGGLLNDLASSGTPYFLTANHCLSTQAEASSLEVWWDFRSAACGGGGPDPATLPKSFGATLLATDPLSDFTFMQLSSIPSKRFFFGWSQADPGSATLRRISNPEGGPQVYSETVSNAGSLGTCNSLPYPDFLYETLGTGSILEGSSGSPVWTGSGIVVGQLLGSCGPKPDDTCDARNSTVDGRFETTFPFVQEWLVGPPAPPIPPSNLKASKVKKKKLTLSWTDNAFGAFGEDAYEIRLFDGAAWTALPPPLAANTVKVIVTGLLPKTDYRFAVRACLAGTCSGQSEVSAKTKK